jgi:predicted O-methyltransferase YrrM
MKLPLLSPAIQLNRPSTTLEGMSTEKNYLAGDIITEYVRSLVVNESDVLRRLRHETASLPDAVMQITPDQGLLLEVLLGLVGAKRTLEIGVFTGYSSTVTALALPPDGHVFACDVSDEFTSVARRYWAEAGVAGKITLRIGPAVQTLQQLLAEGHRASFDFAFIDADKEAYDAYYELALQLIRPGGLIMLDNMLRRGEVVDPAVTDPASLALRNLNDKIARDGRVRAILLPVVDGVTLAWKKTS